MLETIKGHYRNGKIELYEKPHLKESEIIITFLNSEEAKPVDLSAKGITKEEAGDLRSRLITFETDWNAEGMELYDKI
ncbi:MAG: hypothetical protein HZB84_03915 [Deltaproteobacteria bacterium]|nr:hypothetical protein [Deltaproteobacteria bacterium]